MKLRVQSLGLRFQGNKLRPIRHVRLSQECTVLT